MQGRLGLLTSWSRLGQLHQLQALPGALGGWRCQRGAWMEQSRVQWTPASKFLQTSTLRRHKVTELEACKLSGPSAGAQVAPSSSPTGPPTSHQWMWPKGGDVQELLGGAGEDQSELGVGGE